MRALRSSGQASGPLGFATDTRARASISLHDRVGVRYRSMRYCCHRRHVHGAMLDAACEGRTPMSDGEAGMWAPGRLLLVVAA